jgi:hypothetical protein
VIRVFGGIRVRSGMEDRERQFAEQMSSAVEGCRVSSRERPTRLRKVNRSGCSGSIPASRWTTGSTKGEQLAAQAGASEFYESFWVEDAETYREYAWKDGGHADDADVTSLFS